MSRHTLVRFFKRFYETSPKQIVISLKHRIKYRNRQTYSFERMLASSVKLRPGRIYDYLNRYETILQRKIGWKPLSFEGQHVLEVGCGPQYGFGPLAIFLGASSYVGYEPRFNPDILRWSHFKEVYLRYTHKDLSAIYGERMPFEQFWTTFLDRSEIRKTQFLDSTATGSFDITLSNSALEHADSLDEVIKSLKKVSAPGSRFIHIVDFGSHLPDSKDPGKNPLKGIYTTDKDGFFRRHGHIINLYRGPDVLRLFKDAGFKVNMVPYYYFEEFFNDEISSYWKDKYTKEDQPYLFMKTGIFAGSVRSKK